MKLLLVLSHHSYRQGTQVVTSKQPKQYLESILAICGGFRTGNLDSLTLNIFNKDASFGRLMASWFRFSYLVNSSRYYEDVDSVFLIIRMSAGVVRQHPPISFAPSSFHRRDFSARLSSFNAGPLHVLLVAL